jgi:hypothetical protein
MTKLFTQHNKSVLFFSHVEITVPAGDGNGMKMDKGLQFIKKKF